MISSSLFLIFYLFISKLTSDILLWIASNFSNSIFSSKSHPLKSWSYFEPAFVVFKGYTHSNALRYDSYQQLVQTCNLISVVITVFIITCKLPKLNLHTHAGFKWPSLERTLEKIVCKHICNTTLNLAMLTTVMQHWVFIIWIFFWAQPALYILKKSVFIWQNCFERFVLTHLELM